ncbi:MAG TPA: 5'/3'-nucleotidase SurE [Opitutaceae bacterium]|nr:5'/3'-nucleotidase SurE [Opitutaceae bacterium]
MRLLVTNDDGVGSVLLRELVRALLAAGHETYVVAPKAEQSWISAAKSHHRPVASGQADRGLGCPTWIVDGTPSDSVNIAIEHLLPCRPQAVISGINIGVNASLGFILGSGTVAGACEGALHGIPAIALSQSFSVALYETLKRKGGDPDEAVLAVIRMSAGHAARIAPALAAQAPARTFVVHNLNFPYPCAPDAQVRRTVPARILSCGLFGSRAEDGAHKFAFKTGEDLSPEPLLTDLAALEAGFISHTVLDYSKLGSI